MSKFSFDTYIWANDLYSNTGEGILGLSFIKNYEKKFPQEKILIQTPFKKFFFNKRIYINKNNLNTNFITNYFFPLYAIILIWFYYFNKKKVCYLNFLPLWNFFLIFFLPKRTILGPITGRYENLDAYGFKYFIRKYIFSFLYLINVRILLRKYKYLFFSTDLLITHLKLNVKEKKRIFCNFVLSCFIKNNLQVEKNIDFLIYYRDYETKNSKFLNFCVNNLKNKNIHIVGSFLNSKRVKNHGLIGRKKVIDLLRRTKFTIISEENFLSLFFLDAVSCSVNIFYSRKLASKTNYFNSIVAYPLNFSQKISNVDFILKKNFLRKKKANIKINFQNKLTIDINNYFSQFSK